MNTIICRGYDYVGNLCTITNPDGSIEINSYDSAGRITEKALYPAEKEDYYEADTATESDADMYSDDESVEEDGNMLYGPLDGELVEMHYSKYTTLVWDMLAEYIIQTKR